MSDLAAAAALPADIRDIAAAQAEVFGDVAAGLSDADLVAPTLCAGWLAAHLLAHVRLGLAEQAANFAEPAGPDEPADRDYVSYWRDWPAATDPVTYAQVRWLWATASAYATADSTRRHFADTIRQAAGMSRHAPAGRFRFQGHVLEAEDILAIWTVELVIHQLDLTAYLPGERQVPVPAALALTVRTLDGLAGGAGTRPPSWDDVSYTLKGTGRLPLSDADREFLGNRAGKYPAFG